jgi:hypothetical protein
MLEQRRDEPAADAELHAAEEAQPLALASADQEGVEIIPVDTPPSRTSPFVPELRLEPAGADFSARLGTN